ncbi:hypothetical protein ACPCYX_16785 [Pseudomonas fluorescens]|uniref:hypothetical protein n=1 Tax=Pseudomonas fluorescens TaxID=294 RepID=UPI003C1AF970
MPTTAITTQQLANLADVSPSFFSLHRDVLPETFVVPCTNPQGGRPANAYSLQQLAELILERTSFLSDTECRLRVALAASARKTKPTKLGPFRLVTNAKGECLVVPHDLDSLAPHDRAEAEDALAYEAATRIDPVNRRTYFSKDHRHE